VEGDWELLDGEDLLEGVGDLVEGEGELLGHKEVDQLPEGKIRSHPPPPSLQTLTLILILSFISGINKMPSMTMKRRST